MTNHLGLLSRAAIALIATMLAATPALAQEASVSLAALDDRGWDLAQTAEETQALAPVTSLALLESEPPATDDPAITVRPPARDHASFGKDVAAIKWEVAGIYGYYTAINASKLFRDDRRNPRVIKEGWFGRDTKNVGVDKLAHAYSTYLVSEVIYSRLHQKLGDTPGIAVSAAVLGSGVMAWSEAFDSIQGDSGWSWEDVAMNTAGAGFSVLRNSVPGLDRKLDYRLMIEPNEDLYTISGKKHFEQQRYFFAVKPAGFKAFERSPLRFMEVHVGYHAKDFLEEDRAAGITPKRHIFVGVGPNFSEIFFKKKKKSRFERAADEVVDYFQLPYTAVHAHVTE